MIIRKWRSCTFTTRGDGKMGEAQKEKWNQCKECGAVFDEDEVDCQSCRSTKIEAKDFTIGEIVKLARANRIWTKRLGRILSLMGE